MPTARETFLKTLAQTSDIPLGLEISRASGCRLYGTDGKVYLDLISGISVSALGHGHPAVIEAVKNQAEKNLHLMVYGEYIQSPQVEFAEFLTKNLPKTLNTVYFTNSGTEATEGAMKLAKRVTGRTQFISCKNAYHGSTQGALSLAGGEWLKNAFRPLLPGVSQIEFNREDELDRITEETAAVFMEPVQGEAGAIVPDTGYLKAVRDRCDQTSTLLVFDEIQTGFGRTGSLWAFEQYGVVPDILLLGKALGGGMPLGAFIADQSLMQMLSHDPVLGHITTFGGHPVSCAAGKAALEAIIENRLWEKAAEGEELVRSILVHPRIQRIKGRGYLLAVELENFEQVKKTISFCLEAGVVADWFLFDDHSVRLAPPLIISEDELNRGCSVILEAVGS